jgi:DNA-binding LacI/PurR family transcriptional regulator
MPSAANGGSPRAQVLNTMRAWIEQGRFTSGQALPSERDLAQELRVARVTVRSALAELAREGLLDTAFRRKPRVAGLAGGGLMAKTVAVLSIVGRERRQAKPVYDEFIQNECSRLVEEAGLHVLTLNPQALLAGGLAHLLAQRPCGVLVSHDIGEFEAGQRLIAACAAAGIAVVAYGYSTQLVHCDVVTADQDAGCAELTRWLLARGHRRILRLWRIASTPNWLEYRNAGYERAMRAAGLEPLPAVYVPEAPGAKSGRELFDARVRTIAGFLVEHLCGPAPIDAVMATTDPHAYQVAAALRLFGRRPNEDIAIVGYDHTWKHYQLHQWEAEGPLATVDKRDTRIAEEMVGLLLDRLAGRLPAAPQRRTVRGDLVEIARP